jgi:predicted GH43/DUF377 family glycosyl hydrolase
MEVKSQGRSLKAGVKASLVFAWCMTLASPLLHGRQPWQLGPFTRPVDAPILTPDSTAAFRDPISGKQVHWEANATFNPAAIVRDGKVYLLYRAEDDTGLQAIGGHTSRLGLAWSSDGIHFTRAPEPVFFAANDAQKSREWPGGVEDPRIVEGPGGEYVLTYTQWNRKATDIGLAASKDLRHWTKYGPIFPHSLGPAFKSYKSGGIVTRLDHGRLVAAKINGNYWMYWGEKIIHLAWSPDLIHWTPVMNRQGHALVLLQHRPGHFDSGFPEVGPPPLLTSKGIVLFYNGKNGFPHGDTQLGSGAYSAGQALFQASDPAKLLARASQPFLMPERPYEKTGQYGAGTTFAEGLVYFHRHWFLYYGCADSRVGVVEAPGSLKSVGSTLSLRQRSTPSAPPKRR